MSSSLNHDTYSPLTTQVSIPQDESIQIANTQQGSPVRRPSFEKLDPAEVAKALQIADLLKDKKPPKLQTQPVQPDGPKKPTPPPAEFIPRPPPIPFSGASNPDAVALRATTDLLQMQKARATENIQRLEQLKELNRKDPKEFLKQLMAGNLKASTEDKEGILGPTVGPDVEKLLAALDVSQKGAGSEKGAGDQEDKSKVSADITEKNNPAVEDDKKDFPRFPTPQNVVRTPAINWAKYGIVGDTLDKMHDEQKTNPTLGEPERLTNRNSQPTTPVVEPNMESEPKAPRFIMAAPYDPLKEQLKKSSRKPC